MTDFAIRDAVSNDIPLVVGYLRAMLQDMTAFGGYPITTDDQLWSRIEANINFDEANHHFWLAEAEQPIGFAEARITNPDLVFQSKSILHIHAVYVLPDFRGQGVGRALVQTAVDLGRANKCHSAQLNTLINNPARKRYESIGFQAREVRMQIKL